jgi:hypothetical protein
MLDALPHPKKLNMSSTMREYLSDFTTCFDALSGLEGS